MLYNLDDASTSLSTYKWLNCLSTSTGNRATAGMPAVDVVVPVARHVDNISHVRSSSAPRHICECISECDGTKVRQSSKTAAAEGDGFNNPIGVSFAKRAWGFIRGKLMCERPFGPLVRESCDASSCRVCLHFHEDSISRRNVPALIKVLDTLLRPPLIPGYSRFVSYILCVK